MVSTLSRTQGDLLVLFAALIWGVAFYFQKTAMSHIGPLLFIGLRSAVAVIALVPFALAEDAKAETPTRRVLPFAAVGGCLFFAAASVQQFGIVTATVTNTGFLTALYVVATPFIYWLVKKEAPAANVWIAVCLCLAGTWALSGGLTSDFSDGDLLVAASSILWAANIVFAGEAGKLARPLTYTCIQFGVVAILALSLAVMFEPIVFSAILASADSILYVGMLSSAFTFGVMAIALRHIPAPRASIMLSVEILFAALAGYLLLDERLTSFGWVGAVLILAGILVVRLRGSTQT